MGEPELLLLVLMVAVGGLSVLAGVVRVPYPIVLVLGGLVLGFVPGVPPAELPPELVLVLFLPPLLYQAAFFPHRVTCAPTRVRSQSWRWGWSWRP
jgi:NhaP-type Na+/H+ or K+/H+ antiporter